MKVVLKLKRRPVFPAPKGDRCIVLGNGPSLKQVLEHNGDYLKGQTLVCVNLFSLSVEYETLTPTYYVLLDPAIWTVDTPLLKSALEAIVVKTTWTINLLVPHDAKRSHRITNLQKNPNVKIHYFNYIVYKGFDNLGHALYKKNISMMSCQNVLVAALFLSINLGYKRIELFGADHSLHLDLIVNEENILCLRDVHFYDDSSERKYYPFRRRLNEPEAFRIDEAFFGMARAFSGYQRIRRYADYRNVKIINMTKGSFVDAFERGKIEDL